MAQEEHFDAANAPQKISTLIMTVSEKSMRFFLCICFAEMFIVVSFWPVFLEKKVEKNGTQKKKHRFLLLFIQYQKTLLLGYQNQNHHVLFQFLHLLRRRLQSWQGAAPGSKPRIAK